MPGLGKFSDVSTYIDARIEWDLSQRDRRVSLVGGDEVARIGAIAFVGPDAEDAQEVIDAEVGRGIAIQSNPERSAELTDATDLVEIAEGDLAIDIRNYVEMRVRWIVAHSSGSDTRSSVAADRVPMSFAGKWRDDATYRRGDTVMRTGLPWHCNSDGTTDVPGTSSSWSMVGKSHGKHDKPGEAA